MLTQGLSHKRRGFALALIFGLPICFFVSTGCAPGRGEVSGKVTYQGRPVVYGSVQFIGSDNEPRLAEINTDGTYAVQGVIAGENRVLVHSSNPAHAARVNKFGQQIEPPPVDPKLWFPIPEKYGLLDQSDLTFTIQANKSNLFDIDLK
jgi:hypothetical protein